MLTLYTYLCYGDQFEYKPNYKCDDNGIPYSHAPGNVGDIEVFNRDNYWLIEATLIRNKTQQINSETINLFRHITDLKYSQKYMTMVAPYIHDDTELMISVASLIVSIEKDVTVYAATSTINDFVIETFNKNNFTMMEEKNISFMNSIKEHCEKIV